LKTIVPLLSCTKNTQDRRRGRGRGGGGLEPPEVLEVEKNITINEPKNI